MTKINQGFGVLLWIPIPMMLKNGSRKTICERRARPLTETFKEGNQLKMVKHVVILKINDIRCILKGCQLKKSANSNMN